PYPAATRRRWRTPRTRPPSSSRRPTARPSSAMNEESHVTGSTPKRQERNGGARADLSRGLRMISDAAEPRSPRNVGDDRGYGAARREPSAAGRQDRPAMLLAAEPAP